MTLDAIELNLGLTRIGRGEDNDLVVPDASVSSHHCEILWLDNVIRIRDLDSTNGTFLDGQPVRESSVPPNSCIVLGEIPFVITCDEARVAIPELAATETIGSIELADGKMSCVSHPDEVAVWECTKCGQLLCWSCVRRVRVAGRRPLTFCHGCDGQCRPAKQAMPVKPVWKRWFTDPLRCFYRKLK